MTEPLTSSSGVSSTVLSTAPFRGLHLQDLFPVKQVVCSWSCFPRGLMLRTCTVPLKSPGEQAAFDSSPTAFPPQRTWPTCGFRSKFTKSSIRLSSKARTWTLCWVTNFLLTYKMQQKWQVETLKDGSQKALLPLNKASWHTVRTLKNREEQSLLSTAWNRCSSKSKLHRTATWSQNQPTNLLQNS